MVAGHACPSIVPTRAPYAIPSTPFRAEVIGPPGIAPHSFTLLYTYSCLKLYMVEPHVAGRLPDSRLSLRYSTCVQCSKHRAVPHPPIN